MNHPAPYEPGETTPAQVSPAQYPGYEPEYDIPEESGGMENLRRYLAAAKRYKWMILIITLVGSAAGFVAARFVPLKYRAQATVWISEEAAGGSDRGPIQTGGLLSQSTAWVDLLRSFVVLDYVVRQEHLYLQPKGDATRAEFADFGLQDRFRPGDYEIEVAKDGGTFKLQTTDGQTLQEGRVGEPVGEKVGFDWTPGAQVLKPGRELRFAVDVPREASLQLAQELQTSIDQNGRFLSLQLVGRSPEEVAGTLNAILKRYTETAAELKRSKLDELTKILKEQLSRSENNLRQAEGDLEAFRVHTITLPSERASPVAPGLQMTQDPVFDNYFKRKLEADQIRQDREAIVQALQGGVSVEALEIIPSVQSSTELMKALAELTDKQASLRAMKYRYTEEHPPVKQLESEIATLEDKTIPNLANALVASLGNREQEISQQIASAGSDLQQIPPRAIEEARLRRQVAISDNLYTTLQQRYEEARLAAVSSIPDVRVIDQAAVPNEPMQNTKLQTIALAFLGSLGLGLLGAVLRDRVDPKFRYPEQVTHGLGMPILGTLPHVSRNGRLNGGAATVHQAVESLRELRLSMAHAHGSAGPMVVAISSAGSGDGKSMLSSNLALSYADLGRRVLLIDGDTRRGALHRLVRGKRVPGLTDFLRGGLSVDDVVQETEFPSLHLISSGTRLSKSPELLGAPALRQLIAHLRPRYDVILIDSPPMGAGADAFMLGSLAGNMVLVVRTGSTDRQLMESKLPMLERLPIRILGVVLNDVPREQVYGYYGYLPGYGVEEGTDEAEQESPQPPQLQES